MYKELDNFERIVKFARDYSRLDIIHKDYFEDILLESDWIDRDDIDKLGGAIEKLAGDEITTDNVNDFIRKYSRDIMEILEGLENSDIRGYADNKNLVWDLADFTGGGDFYSYYIEGNKDIVNLIVDDYLECSTSKYFISEAGHIIEWV